MGLGLAGSKHWQVDELPCNGPWCLCKMFNFDYASKACRMGLLYMKTRERFRWPINIPWSWHLRGLYRWAVWLAVMTVCRGESPPQHAVNSTHDMTSIGYFSQLLHGYYGTYSNHGANSGLLPPFSFQVRSPYSTDAAADLGMFSTFHRTGAPQKVAR